MIALVLIGPTGSGKTSLAKSVEELLSITRISSGDIARDLAKSDSYARAGLSRGEMAPELAMRAEVLHRIEAVAIESGDFIIEGFPRTVEQLYILESVPRIRPVYFVLDVDPLVCLRRLIARSRDDDHADAVATRLRHYHEQTKPMLELLHNSLWALDGAMHVEELADLVDAEYRRELR